LCCISLVLIHGLDGNRIRTWTHQQSKVFWPKDLLPKKQPQTRVMTFGYSADIYQNNSIAGIRDIARALLARLIDEREDLDEARPIVFLAHSLGGLIVKQASRFSGSTCRLFLLTPNV
jgi:triacylglycerol esterase/lipase EstA (alpha/beta hydrolase family)